MDIQIGKVSHYYDKLKVAVIEVTKQSLKVGDTVKISGHDKEFTQEVGSLQIEHEKVDSAKKGDVVGLKTKELIKDGAEVYKI